MRVSVDLCHGPPNAPRMLQVAGSSMIVHHSSDLWSNTTVTQLSFHWLVRQTEEMACSPHPRPMLHARSYSFPRKSWATTFLGAATFCIGAPPNRTYGKQITHHWLRSSLSLIYSGKHFASLCRLQRGLAHSA